MRDYKTIEIRLKVKGEIIDKKFYESIKKAMEPDDRDILSYVSITYDIGSNYIIIRLSTDRKIESVEGVLDDVFRCIKSSLESLEVVKENYQ